MVRKIELPPRPPGEKDWIINDIKVGGVDASPTNADLERYRAARALAARRHDPQIFRTLNGGPGNRRRIHGCACGAPEAHAGAPPHMRGDEASWCAHVGIPGAESFLSQLLSLQDAADDVLHYPDQPQPLDRLRAQRVLGVQFLLQLRCAAVVARTTGEGPGNTRRVVGCACGAPDARDATSWCAHVGVPGAEAIFDQLLALQDAVDDVLDHPEDPRCRERLRTQPRDLAHLTAAAAIFARAGSGTGSDPAASDVAADGAREDLA